MFGSVSEWFYRGLGGIEAAPDAAGFDRIIIRPQPVGDLREVKAHYDSVRGRIVSEWSRKGDKFKLRVRVPVGVVATVFLPAKDGTAILAGNRPVERAPGVMGLRKERGVAVLAIGSGEYEFRSQLEGTCCR